MNYVFKNAYVILYLFLILLDYKQKTTRFWSCRFCLNELL
jgi:hypothetical protein